MCDHNGNLIQYKTEQEMLDVLKGDRLKPNLKPVWQATMLVDAASYGWNTAIEHINLGDINVLTMPQRLAEPDVE